MSDGTLSVRRRQPEASESSSNDLALAAFKTGGYESFLGALPSIGQGRVKSKEKSKPIGDVDEFRVERKRKKRLKEYDRLLKSFKYSAALDSVLRTVRLLFSTAHTLTDCLTVCIWNSTYHQQPPSH